MKVERKHDLLDLQWLVERRACIQGLSAELAQVMKDKGAALKADKDAMEAVLLMVGAAFSLWRAIFLAHTNRESSPNFDAAQAFIWKVVRDNSINYIDDVKSQTWSFGFYLNNCRFRLKAIWERVGLDTAEIAWIEKTLPITLDVQVEWPKHFAALEKAFRQLLKRQSGGPA